MIGLSLPLSLSAQTIDELKTRAANGDAKAQYNLGDRYYNGEGVEVDYVQCAVWLEKAAEQGHEKAQQMLSLLELYALDCYRMTETHKININAVTTIDELNYDYTTGYPEQLQFEIWILS